MPKNGAKKESEKKNLSLASLTFLASLPSHAGVLMFLRPSRHYSLDGGRTESRGTIRFAQSTGPNVGPDFLFWQLVKTRTQRPRGCKFHPWSHGVGSSSGLAVSCGVVHRCGLHPTLLWLWLRLGAAALRGPLAWELPYATGAVPKRKENVDCVQKYPHRHTQHHERPRVQASCGSVKSTHKINHHAARAQLLASSFSQLNKRVPSPPYGSLGICWVDEVRADDNRPDEPWVIMNRVQQ